MPRKSRLLVGLAALLLLGVAFWPLWEVRLLAPQYPEGLGLQIHINTVKGLKTHDLESINGLNHYIGMRVINPDAIPELRYMPWIVGVLILAGLATALRGSQRMLYGWLLTFMLLGGVGLWDFWRWEYNYGHDLDMEEAIIVVPGMSYQPPLIGSKQLLNFTATAWPAPGAWLMGASFLLAAGVAVTERRRRRAEAA